MVDIDAMQDQFISYLANGLAPDDLRDAVEAAIDAAVVAGVIPPEDEDDGGEDDE